MNPEARIQKPEGEISSPQSAIRNAANSILSPLHLVLVTVIAECLPLHLLFECGQLVFHFLLHLHIKKVFL